MRSETKQLGFPGRMMAGAAIVMALFPLMMCAQDGWTIPSGSSSTVTTSSIQSVGVGTSSPLVGFDLRLTDPSYAAQIGIAQTTDYLTFFASDEFGPAIYWDPGKDMRFGAGGAGLYNAGGFSEQMRIQSSSGNVGIGTANPQHKLHVAGTIGAEEIIVSSTGADYVFEPDYHLRPLQEVAQYINQNHHLPDIPSAAEVQQKGMSLGEMQAKLLAKIEELTLHQIELEQQNRDLRERITRMERAGGLEVERNQTDRKTNE